MSVNPDEVVALGAAIQARVLKGEVKDVLLLDVTPLSLGVETRGGVMTKIIERNTTIPVRRTETFSTARGQPAGCVDVVVLQGERERAADNQVLGRFQLTDIRPAPPGHEPRVEVTFDIDASGILQRHGPATGTPARNRGSPSARARGLDRGEVERMVQEAERPTGDQDKALREAVDARNELDAVAYRVEKRLAGPGRRGARAREGTRRDARVRRAGGGQEEAGVERSTAPDIRTPAGTRGVGGPSGRRDCHQAGPARTPPRGRSHE
ncbi:Hsp70 family protein [Yinghuangia aomiensis]